MPAIDVKGKTDLTHSYLAKCITKTEKIMIEAQKITAKVYLQQYSQLLKHLGGKAMTRETDKEILKKIYKTQKSINTVKDIVELWNSKDKEKLKAEIIQESIKMIDNAFEAYERDVNAIHKRMDSNVSVGFHTDGGFGFVCSNEQNEFPQGTVDRLKLLLNDKIFDKYSSTEVEQDNDWVCRYIHLDKIQEPMDELTKLVLTRLQMLEKRYKSSQDR